MGTGLVHGVTQNSTSMGAGCADALTSLQKHGLELPLAQIPALLGQLEQVKALLWARLATQEAVQGTEDRLLTAREAAERLSVSEDSIYRKRWPFRVRMGAGLVRFSSRGIDEYIRRHRG